MTPPPSHKAKLEAALLKIWYGGHQPSLAARLCLNLLTIVYKTLRTVTRQESKIKASKGHTRPPVLVVGNLIAGGAGKTPVVIAVCQYLTAQGKKAGVISRGYGRASQHARLIDPGKPLPKVRDVGDEPLFICAETHCPVAVCADRNQAIDTLLLAFPDLDLVISDDGLQHHRLQRQLEWVVFDERGHGNGKLLPAGPLREPMARLNTVDAVLSSNGSVNELSITLKLPAQANWHETQVILKGFRHLQTGRLIPVEQAIKNWKDLDVLAFTGIANPDKLFSTITDAGIAPGKTLSLPDHFNYPGDFCAQFDQAVLITSGKDAVKLNASNSRVWVAEISVELPKALTQSLEDCIGFTTD